MRSGPVVLQVRAAPSMRVGLQVRMVRQVLKVRLVLKLLRHILLHMRRSEQPSNLLGPEEHMPLAHAPVEVELGLLHSAQLQPLPVLPQPQQAR